MEQFRNAYHSHEHSVYQVLNLIYGYDDFLESIETVAVMGCGAGLDCQWWATLENKEDPPEPYNYRVYGVDIDINRVTIEPTDNLQLIQGDFETVALPERVDLIYCHDAFQFALNPLQTIRHWNQLLNVNGMLVIAYQQPQSYVMNRWNSQTMSGCLHNHTFGTMLYMLALSGFDCRDAYFYKQPNNPWLYAAVYKNDEKFLDPSTTTWYDLCEKRVVNDSVIESVRRYGHLKMGEIFYPWLDKDYHYAQD